MEVLLILQVFIFGLVWGSFLNMAVYRVKHEMNFSGRSFCDHTKENLTWKDLIPLLSYTVYKGKCRHCGEKLPKIYPIVEVLTGILFIFGFWHLWVNYIDKSFLGLNLFITIIYILFFLFFAIYDYLYWEVNVRAIKSALVSATIFSIIAIILNNYQLVIPGIGGFIGAFVAGLIIYLIVKSTKGSGMGEGDIYLMAFAGFVVGIDGLIPLFLISSVSGSIIGIIKALKIKKFHGVQIQFVPFISFAALAVFFWKDFILKILSLDDFFSLINNYL
jgi:prepilin signal peptidase PulO-like enzyme (type II secretory pathway)